VCRDGTIVGANLLGDTRLAARIREAVEQSTQLADLKDLLADFPQSAERAVD
jgi:NAD(P)H-nitrite reductase large subunit